MEMRVAWLSDVHLDFVGQWRRRWLAARVAARLPDTVVISGDLADGRTVAAALATLATWIRCPIYFVLGNHDFYHRQIADVRAEVVAGAQAPARTGALPETPLTATKGWPANLRYLPAVEVAQLGPGVAVVGHDGWADGRNGDYAGSRVVPHDFRYIHDFQVLGTPEQRLRLMQRLAGEAAAHFARVLPRAAAAYARVIAITHTPPFAEASCYRGAPSGPDVLPFYSNRCVGEVLREVMARYPACRLTVLAGHTHGACRYVAAPNIEVLTPAATYGRPGVAGLLRLGAPRAAGGPRNTARAHQS